MPPIATTPSVAPAAANPEGKVATLAPTSILAPLARVLFGIPIVVFGIQHFIYARFVVTLMQPWMPWRSFWTYFTGIALIAAGTSILVGRMARLAATLLGAMVFLFFLLVHIPQVVASPEDPNQWTYMSQAFTFSGMALVIAGVIRDTSSWPPSAVVARTLRLGRWLVAIGLLVLGSRQLLQVPFVLGLVPPWYPGQSFWALLSAVLLIATGAGVALKRERVPAILLGGVLLLFLVLFHVPSLAGNPRGGDWGATCKDSILCGGALALAAARRTRER